MHSVKCGEPNGVSFFMGGLAGSGSLMMPPHSGAATRNNMMPPSLLNNAASPGVGAQSGSRSLAEADWLKGLSGQPNNIEGGPGISVTASLGPNRHRDSYQTPLNIDFGFDNEVLSPICLKILERLLLAPKYPGCFCLRPLSTTRGRCVPFT